MVNLGKGYVGVLYNIFFCLKLFQKYIFKKHSVEIISKFRDKIILNLNSIYNQNTIKVLEQNKDMFRYSELRIFLRLWALIELSLESMLEQKGKHRL